MHKKENLMNVILMLIILMLTSSCNVTEYVEARLRNINKYEEKALKLAKENRNLKASITNLKYELKTLESKNFYLDGQIQAQKGKIKELASVGDKKIRTIASVAPPKKVKMIKKSEDLVEFDTYKWTPSQTLAIANKEFGDANYVKAAQYFHTFITKYPGHEKLDDKVLFQAGISAFESGKYHKWALTHFGELIKNHPTSAFYRGAKLWSGLTYLKTGESENFFATVEEFRKKYRNTSEWKILSRHYEKIVQKHKKQL